MKTRVAVIFGGRSVEHEVSIISGIQAFAALNREKYDPIPLYLSKNNEFYTGPHMGDIERYKDMDACLRDANPGSAGAGGVGGADAAVSAEKDSAPIWRAGSMWFCRWSTAPTWRMAR